MLKNQSWSGSELDCVSKSMVKSQSHQISHDRENERCMKDVVLGRTGPCFERVRKSKQVLLKEADKNALVSLGSDGPSRLAPGSAPGRGILMAFSTQGGSATPRPDASPGAPLIAADRRAPLLLKSGEESLRGAFVTTKVPLYWMRHTSRSCS